MWQTQNVYLRTDVIIEPLVDRWYAWPHLISPATAARNITERHLKIMASYVEAPELHAMAVRNPKMKGGPFMDYDRNRCAEVQALIKETTQRRGASIALSQALVELDRLLDERATGGPMAALYQQVPEALRGLVELYYNRSGHPDFRLVEPLLYRAYADGRSAQSLFLTVGDGIRPFMMSTPRLPDPEEEVILHTPFDHPGVDMLFEMLQTARPLEELAEMLEIRPTMQARLRALVTERPPYRPAPRTSRWRYFGHACVMLETPDCTILLDPAIKTEDENRDSGFSYADLPERIDYVLLTHNHQDHVLLETLLRLRQRIGAILVPRSGGGALVDPSLRLALGSLGFRNVVELDEFGTAEAKGATITALPFLGEHGDLAIRCKTTWHVRLDSRSLLFAADCKNISPHLFRRVREATGRVDTLFLGMECDGAPMTWIYGPLFMHPPTREHDQTRRLAGCDLEEAAGLVEIFEPSEIFVYAMGIEPWLNYIMATRYTPESNPIVASQQLIDACRARGLRAERLYGAREVAL
jgi:L-ascorbate metabolism protein UlaG (beta-lactamase superfamily)